MIIHYFLALYTTTLKYRLPTDIGNWMLQTCNYFLVQDIINEH